MTKMFYCVENPVKTIVFLWLQKAKPVSLTFILWLQNPPVLIKADVDQSDACWEDGGFMPSHCKLVPILHPGGNGRNYGDASCSKAVG